MKNYVPQSILLMPILIMLSCSEVTPIIALEKDASRCPVCPACSTTSSTSCTENKVEKCIEGCIGDENCFFGIRIKSCIKKCTHGCLNILECNWKD